MRGDFASNSATPLIALPIASNHLRLQSHSVCIVLVFTALTMTGYVFHVTSAPCDFGLTTSRTPPQFALRTPLLLEEPLLTNTRYTHHDHAHCDSHLAGCLHRTASTTLLSMPVLRVCED